MDRRDGGSRRRGGVATHDVEFAAVVRRARDPARRRRPDRRRPGRGDSLGRLVLRHRGGPHPRGRRSDLAGARRRAASEPAEPPRSRCDDLERSPSTGCSASFSRAASPGSSARAPAPAWWPWSRRWRRWRSPAGSSSPPIPNVVATTDIVLITGFAVGAAPGFAVGALAAAVSNIWLGQGPWTPWEMAGWGLVGLGGAGLADGHPADGSAGSGSRSPAASRASPTGRCSTSP